MPRSPASLRSLRERIEQEQREEQDAQVIRQQAAQVRQVGRQNYFLSLPLLGTSYERARLEDKSLRPASFAQGVRDGRFHVGLPTLETPQAGQRGAETALGGPSQAQELTGFLREGLGPTTAPTAVGPQVPGQEQQRADALTLQQRSFQVQAINIVLEEEGISLDEFRQLSDAVEVSRGFADARSRAELLVATRNTERLQAEQAGQPIPPKLKMPAVTGEDEDSDKRLFELHEKIRAKQQSLVEEAAPELPPLGVELPQEPRPGTSGPFDLAGIGEALLRPSQETGIERATAPVETLSRLGVEGGIQPLITPLTEQGGGAESGTLGEQIEKVPIIGESLRRAAGNLTTPALAPLLAVAPAGFIGGEAAATVTGSVARAAGASPGQVTAAELAGDVLVGGGIEAGAARGLRGLLSPGQKLDDLFATLERQAGRTPTGQGEVGEILSDARALAAPTRATEDIAPTLARVGDDAQPRTRDISRILHEGDTAPRAAQPETVARQAPARATEPAAPVARAVAEEASTTPRVTARLRSVPPASGTPEFATRSGVSETELRAAVDNKDLPEATRKLAREHLGKVCK